MNISWKPIMSYELDADGAQAAYDAIFKAALSYKFRKSGLSAVPIYSEMLTDAIFKLNSHDQLELGSKTIDGQKVKELFITTIFLKHLERQFDQGDQFFIALPEEETSCDTAVFVSKRGVPTQGMGSKKLKLSPNHHPFLFQIKEYVDFNKLSENQLELPEPVNPEEIERYVQKYSEHVLIFVRKLLNYRSDDLKKFFQKNTNCCLISSPFDVETIPKRSATGEYEPIRLDSSKHNYVITLANETFAIASFARPAFLVEKGQVLPTFSTK